MRFYLGTHVLNHIDKANVPLFVSYRQLRKRKRKPFNHQVPICVDSGGFSELNLNGKWTITPDDYISDLDRLSDLGLIFEWAAPQDWMCEDIMLNKTGKTVSEHQELTVKNYIDLIDLTKEHHIIPVLQGQNIDDYFTHFEMYEENGIQLRKERTVGLGSVCRRQSSDDIEKIVKSLHSKELNLHGFGVKTNGLRRYARFLQSADSLAWSFGARYSNSKCNECEKKPILNCANCLNYALNWRRKIIEIEGVE